MELRWYELCDRLKVPWEAAEEQWTVFEKKYGEPHRYFHNLDHIESCINYLEISPVENGKELIELAIWFHDLYYNVFAEKGINETASAKDATLFMMKNGLYTEFIVKMAIGSTVKHIPEDFNIFCTTMVDVDLGCLGLPEEQYREYREKVKNEFISAGVPEKVFRKERIKFLDGMTEKNFIYWTPEFQYLFTESAVRNLEAELERYETDPLFI
jgi:predicted metal-dependent HD superfamily phosphohydrolase